MKQWRRDKLISVIGQYKTTCDIEQLLEDIETIMEPDIDEVMDIIETNGWEIR